MQAETIDIRPTVKACILLGDIGEMSKFFDGVLFDRRAIHPTTHVWEIYELLFEESEHNFRCRSEPLASTDGRWCRSCGSLMSS